MEGLKADYVVVVEVVGDRVGWEEGKETDDVRGEVGGQVVRNVEK